MTHNMLSSCCVWVFIVYFMRLSLKMGLKWRLCEFLGVLSLFGAMKMHEKEEIRLFFHAQLKLLWVIKYLKDVFFESRFEISQGQKWPFVDLISFPWTNFTRQKLIWNQMLICIFHFEFHTHEIKADQRLKKIPVVFCITFGFFKDWPLNTDLTMILWYLFSEGQAFLEREVYVADCYGKLWLEEDNITMNPFKSHCSMENSIRWVLTLAKELL